MVQLSRPAKVKVKNLRQPGVERSTPRMALPSIDGSRDHKTLIGMICRSCLLSWQALNQSKMISLISRTWALELKNEGLRR